MPPQIDRSAIANGRSEADRLDILSTLVEAYEKTHFPIAMPDPIEAIHYYMDTRGLCDRDLEPYLGSQARVSEILSRKRFLTLEMIRKLNQGLMKWIESMNQELLNYYESSYFTALLAVLSPPP